MAEYEDRERFIPFRKSEIVEMICNDGKLNKKDQEQFRDFAKILASLYHFEFHKKVEELKENYYPFNPDKDTKTKREYPPDVLRKCEENLVKGFTEILNDANYEQITEKEIEYALEEESLFKISLYVDFEDFSSYLLFFRGEVVKQVEIKKFFFKKETIEVPTYQRVAMLIKFKGKDYFKKKKRKILFEPGSMVIKLFKNIPKADLEMLFPNTQIKMKPKDKILMGAPAILGAVPILLNKGVALVLAIPVLFAVIALLIKGGDLSEIPPQQMGLLIGAGVALGALGGYAWRQWDKFKNRKIQFMKALADNLYFKNLDNNAGVFHHIIDAAEEEECKEAILGYYFLLMAGEKGLTEPALDDTIEEWFENQHQTLIDFEVDDALRKLKELKLCTVEDKGDPKKHIYRAKTLDQACEQLDYIWDNYFQYNQTLE